MDKVSKDAQAVVFSEVRGKVFKDAQVVVLNKVHVKDFKGQAVEFSKVHV